jgi:alanyl-tRNA synthetase
MTSREIRKTFLQFFADRGHTVVRSSSLVPAGDPTLLFTNAGMVQFKPLWAGAVPLPYRRATSVQKCLRLSDLEAVGESIKHDTFFEMLGNFSFGDYFKQEAIEWAWEYMRDVAGIPEERMAVSVHESDDEAHDIWQNVIGLHPAKIARLGDEENFWGPAGGTGACGPCSEIFYDRGPESGCRRPGCAVGCDCDRFFEVYNIVFPQYNQDEDGRRHALENRGIDTGMGLERLAMVLQGVSTIFDIDVFLPIIEMAMEIAGLDSGVDRKRRRALRIVADHARALAFAIADGALPSNDGRGYVVRRLLRRAVRQGRILGLDEPFLYRLAGVVADVMGEAYPELGERREQTALLIHSEEERFLMTLDQGLMIFERVAAEAKRAGTERVPGSEAFRLYDTYGFPLDMTQEMAHDYGLTVDVEGFERAMAEQRERAKAASRFEAGPAAGRWVEYRPCESVEFLGYDLLEARARISRWRRIDEETVAIILERTPFYAQAGGQTGDTGTIRGESFEVQVRDTQSEEGVPIHVGRIVRGEIADEEVAAIVDSSRRRSIARSHTATHLLQAALREVLGEHVHQEGSLVEPDRLRFDFVHYQKMDRRELDRVEARINELVRENLPVEPFHAPLEEAKAMGAIALFGEKYGERVRALRIGDASLELCAGTHLGATGEIGLVRILSEGAVAAGVRRIEAITGEAAYAHMKEEDETINLIAEELKASPAQVRERVDRLIAETKELERRVRSLERKLAAGGSVRLAGATAKVKGIKVMSTRVDVENKEIMREMADALRREQPVGMAGVLGALIEGKAAFVAFVSDDLVKQGRLRAGDIAREVAKIAGGGGGGKPHLAEAGGKDGHKLDEALKAVPRVVGELIGD